MVILMSIITREALELHAKVRDNYPKTYEWMKHKARWEHIPMGVVCMEHRDFIEQLMREEDGK